MESPAISRITSKPVLYFGYGSNLWLDQMHQRCPTADFLGVARLTNFRWIISSRGYANIVQLEAPSDASDVTATVYGLVFSLQPSDEARLDVNEGVAFGAYTKEHLDVDYWPKEEANGRVQKTPMLVYIDRARTDGNHRPKDEYVVRMNNGIRDALANSVPEEYVQKVLRHWIPEHDPTGAGKMAMKQALHFVDEN